MELIVVLALENMENLITRVEKKLTFLQLHLGIKSAVHRIYYWVEYTIDNSLIYPLHNFINSYIERRIIIQYGADYHWGDFKSQNLGSKNRNLGYGLFHQALILNLKPKRILCVGSMYGFIPFMMANACMKNNVGHVDFVDAGFDINSGTDTSRHFFGQGFWKNTGLDRHFSYFLKKGFLTPYIMTTREFAQKHRYKYDYIYLDGDHSYQGALLDIKLFWSRLSDRGVLCFHDIHFKKPLKGVKFEFWKIWKDLSAMPYKFELSNLYSGLGFIQKIGNKKIPLQ